MLGGNISRRVAAHCANFTNAGPNPCNAWSVYHHAIFDKCSSWASRDDNIAAGVKIQRGESKRATSALRIETQNASYIFWIHFFILCTTRLRKRRSSSSDDGLNANGCGGAGVEQKVYSCSVTVVSKERVERDIDEYFGASIVRAREGLILSNGDAWELTRRGRAAILTAALVRLCRLFRAKMEAIFIKLSTRRVRVTACRSYRRGQTSSRSQSGRHCGSSEGERKKKWHVSTAVKMSQVTSVSLPAVVMSFWCLTP